MRKVTKADLDIIVSPDGHDKMPYRDLFKYLLVGLVEDGDMFSGKRACWNSDWLHRICCPLYDHGLIKGGKTEEDGWTDYEFEEDEAKEVLVEMINLM